MGGTAILIATWAGYLIAVGVGWAGGGSGSTASAPLLLYLTTGLAVVGGFDDVIKLRKHRNLGLNKAGEVPRPNIRRTDVQGPLRTLTADRGYGEASVDQGLTDLGLRTVVIPRKADLATPAVNSNTGGRSDEPVRWRTGCEGRISTFKADEDLGQNMKRDCPGFS